MPEEKTKGVKKPLETESVLNEDGWVWELWCLLSKLLVH